MHTHYLVMAHSAPSHLTRLVRRLSGPDATVWLHVDATSDLSAFAETLGLPGVRLVEPRVDVVWGTFSQVEATLSAMRRALADGRPGHLVLMSGVDFPIKSSDHIRAYLAAHRDTVHREGGPIKEVWPDFHQHKTDYYMVSFSGQRGDFTMVRPLSHMGLRERLGWTKRFVREFGLRRGLEVAARTQDERRSPIAVMAGSNWWAMPTRVARVVLEWADSHPDYARYHEFTQCPDEIFFHSILAELQRAGVDFEVADQLCYIDWSYGDWERPKVLGESDLATLLDQPTGKLFARKFAEGSPVVDELDERLA